MLTKSASPAARTASAASGVPMWLSAWTTARVTTFLSAAAYGTPRFASYSDTGMIGKKSKYEPVPQVT